MNENFYQLLTYAFSRNPQGPALLLPDGREISYRDLAAQAAAYSALLGELGVGAGDRVLVQTAKSAEVVALYLGCLRTGAVYVPINTAYTETEVAYFLDDAAPALFVCSPDDEAGFEEMAEADIRVLSLGADGEGSLTSALAAHAGDGKAPPVIDSDDLPEDPHGIVAAWCDA